MTIGVQETSFEVAEGEIFVVMGLSGSGKSTLVRMLNRLIEPTSGTIEVEGEDVTAMDEEGLRRLRLHKISMVFQHFALFPHMTVAENVEYGLKVQRVEAEERKRRALTALEQVGLRAWAESAPSALSGGMQQRVGLARGLAVDPEVLLMDEPFSALDPLIRRDMQLELLRLQERVRKTIVFITHDLNEALVLGDRIAIMRDGRFVQIGTPEEIVSDPADDYVAAFTQDVDRGRVFTARSVAEPAEALSLATDTVGSARSRMLELERAGLHVLDGERIAGLVLLSNISERDDGDSLAAYLLADFPRVHRSDRLYEFYNTSSAGLPIAVVDAKGGLCGVLDPLAVLDALAAPRATNGNGAAPHHPTRTEAGANSARPGG